MVLRSTYTHTKQRITWVEEFFSLQMWIKMNILRNAHHNPTELYVYGRRNGLRVRKPCWLRRCRQWWWECENKCYFCTISFKCSSLFSVAIVKTKCLRIISLHSEAQWPANCAITVCTVAQTSSAFWLIKENFWMRILSCRANILVRFGFLYKFYHV